MWVSGGRERSYARDGYGKIELRGKGEHEDVWGIDFDGRPACGIGVRGGPSVHVEKRVAGRYTISLANDDEIATKGELDGRATLVRHGRIDAGVRLAQIHLPPRRLPSLERLDAVGQGEAGIEWIEDAGEGGARDVLEHLGVHDQLVELAAGEAAGVDVGGAEVGDDLDDELVGEGEEGWESHSGRQARWVIRQCLSEYGVPWLVPEVLARARAH